MLGWLRRLFHPKPARRSRGIVRLAKYDSAQTTHDNRRHWANADALSARAANSPAIRCLLRKRSRYERDNGSYVKGAALTLANDLIGVGPKLQILTDDREVNRRVELTFRRWAKRVKLASKLRTATQAKVIDGEGLGLLIVNRNLRHSVLLDVKPFESEQLTTPGLSREDSRAVDGIVFDEYGNPVEYHVLKEHPGDGVSYGEYDRVPARRMLHWFRADRPGQARGIPEFTAGLPIGAQLRRWSSATLKAAEFAAAQSGVLKSNLYPESADEEGEAWETVEYEHGALTTLPHGYDLQQLDAKHPNTQYPQFKKENLNELGREICMPHNVIAGDSSDANYSSARLDFYLLYRSALLVARAECEDAWLDPLFEEWLEEAIMIPGLLPASLPPPDELEHAWHWPGFAYIDPQKEANADAIRLENHTTTLAEIYAERGTQDWEDALRQRAKEIELMKELGLAPASAGAARARVEEIEDAEHREEEEEEEEEVARA